MTSGRQATEPSSASSMHGLEFRPKASGPAMGLRAFRPAIAPVDGVERRTALLPPGPRAGAKRPLTVDGR